MGPVVMREGNPGAASVANILFHPTLTRNIGETVPLSFPDTDLTQRFQNPESTPKQNIIFRQFKEYLRPFSSSIPLTGKGGDKRKCVLDTTHQHKHKGRVPVEHYIP